MLSHSITYNNSATITGTVKNGDKVKKLTYQILSWNIQILTCIRIKYLFSDDLKLKNISPGKSQLNSNS